MKSHNYVYLQLSETIFHFEEIDYWVIDDVKNKKKHVSKNITQFTSFDNYAVPCWVLYNSEWRNNGFW